MLVKVDEIMVNNSNYHHIGGRHNGVSYFASEIAFGQRIGTPNLIFFFFLKKASSWLIKMALATS